METALRPIVSPMLIQFLGAEAMLLRSGEASEGMLTGYLNRHLTIENIGDEPRLKNFCDAAGVYCWWRRDQCK
jgi:hypothetical protein